MDAGSGVCFGCGKETDGTPVKPDWIILSARRFRSLLSLPGRRTVACSTCLQGLLGKRKKFEKNFFWYKAGGIAFFAVVLLAAAAKNSLGAGAIFGAVAGAAIIATFSLFSYCPDFEKSL